MSNNIHASKYTWADIWREAEIFRKKYVKPVSIIPIPIEEIIEFKLGLEIVPINGLKSKCDIEGFLGQDLKIIYVDNQCYSDIKYLNRLRFTLAHEVGHLILHAEKIKSLKFRNFEEWQKLILSQSDDEIRWIEKQASQFAGRLLVPLQDLEKFIDNEKDNIELFRSKFPIADDNFLLDHLSSKINKHFAVSSDVIKRRIWDEKIII